jgi:hypothetical protein
MEVRLLPTYTKIPMRKHPDAEFCDRPILVPKALRGRNKKLGNKCNNLAKIQIGERKLCVRCAQVYALGLLLLKKGLASEPSWTA